jgi:hypothetical protein
MSHAKSESPRPVPSIANDPMDEAPIREKSSGRAAFDVRGDAIWEWKTETGSYSREISTKRLKKLEALELSLEQTRLTQQLKALAGKELAQAGGGYNPYDRTSLKSAKPAAPIATKPAEKPTPVLGRVRGWLGSK